MSWTDERVSTLKKLWLDGLSASQIAKQLGGVTRNAVIGKAHRLKLSNRLSPIQQNNQKPVKVADAAKRDGKAVVSSGAANAPIPPAAVAAAKAQRPQLVPVMLGKGIALADLTERMCRWPNGDPKEPGFSFCGCPSIVGVPYCPEHTKIAYQAATRNRLLRAEDFEGRPAPVVEDEENELKVAG